MGHLSDHDFTETHNLFSLEEPHINLVTIVVKGAYESEEYQRK